MIVCNRCRVECPAAETFNLSFGKTGTGWLAYKQETDR